MQHDKVEKVFPILRSQLLRCLCENVPRKEEEELKYFHASFIKPRHTIEAASKPPRIQTHAPQMCPNHPLQESFYQLEQNDERDKNATVKTSPQWYPSQTGSVKAHANTSLPSKKNFGIMSSIKRANPDARTRARHGRGNYGCAAVLL